jgi:peroxiredoxin
VKKYSLLILLFFGVVCQQKAEIKTYGPAQEFTLYDADSVVYKLQDFRGKLVMIHFWADWCPHCREEFSKIQQAYTQIDRNDFEILAVNSGQSADHVREIKSTYRLTYPLLVDSEAKTAKLYRVAGLPSTFYVDKNGRIVKVVNGWLTTEDILTACKQLQ